MDRRTILKTVSAVPLAAALPRTLPRTWPSNPWGLRIDTWGDSITWGAPGDDRSKTGYRVKLGQQLTWAGIAHEPIQDFSVIGWGLDNLIAGATARVLGFMPDVICLHIGTNDAGNATLTSTFGARYRHLIDLILVAKPDIKIVGSLLQFSTGPYAGLAWNEALINDQIAAVVDGPTYGSHFLGRTQCQLLPSGILKSDGLHPTDFGLQLYGDQFYNVIAQGYGFPVTS